MKFDAALIVCLALIVGCESGGFSGASGKAKSVPQSQKQDEEIPKQSSTSKGDTQQPDDDEEDVPIDLGDPTAIREACAASALKVKSKTLVFPATQGCPFGVGDNLEEDNGTITARVEQSQVMPLPENAALCGISMKSKTTTIEYDDFIYLLLGDFVLAGDSGGYVNYLSREDDIPVWDWLKVRGTAHDSDSPPFCVSGTCTLPGTETAGPVDIVIDPETAAKIAFSMLDSEELNFRLVSLGDNEDGDCQHTPFELDVDIQYILR